MTRAVVVFALAAAACGGSQAGTTPTSPTSPTAPASPAAPAPDPLRTAALSAGKLVGAAVQSAYLADSRYADVFDRHFNYVTAEYEMKWDPIERTRGAENFSAGDAIANFAAAHGMQ